MYVGMLVTPDNDQALRSGNEWYAHGVVACVNPLQITSLDGDILWSTDVDKMAVHGMVEAHPKYVINGQRRLERHERSLEITMVTRRVFGSPTKKESIPVPKDHPEIECVLRFTASMEVVSMFPAFAGVHHVHDLDVFYCADTDQCYLRHDDRSWAIPLGSAYGRDWYRRLRTEVRGGRSVVRYEKAIKERIPT